MNNELILGIESSCDETSAAVYSLQEGILSNIVYSQDIHKLYGGTVPEIASRSHLEKIGSIIQAALKASNKTLEEINTIAVTNKPGLPGSLLIGVCFAKAIAWAKNKKIIGVNHLEGHAFSTFLEYDVPFPHICLTVSGGHTSVYIVRGFGDYEIIGQTLDDAAGEAFDKIAKLLGLPYPGGPVIEKLAAEVNFVDFFNYPRSMADSRDFSFSGLKTAVLYDLVKRDLYNLQTRTLSPRVDNTIKKQVASSLMACMNDIFQMKISRALKDYPDIKAVTFVGGVACNKFLKKELATFCAKQDVTFFSPSKEYCIDNAAMIAFVGSYKAVQNKYSDLTLDIF